MSTSQSGNLRSRYGVPRLPQIRRSQPVAARELVSAVASLREPRTTMGGVNLGAGFRPELWRELIPADAPPEVEGFNRELYFVPSTQSLRRCDNT